MHLYDVSSPLFAPRIEDMMMLIKQLAQRLKLADTSSDLPAKATNYLRLHRLADSPLRSEESGGRTT